MAEEKMKNHNESSSEESGEEESEESGSEQESTRITQNHPPAIPKSAPHKQNEENEEEEEEDESGSEDSQSESQRSTHLPMKSSAADVNGFVPKSKTQDESASEEGSEYEEEDEEKSPPADSPYNGVPNSMNDNLEEGSEDEDVDKGKRSPSITGKTKAAKKGEVQAQGEKCKKARVKKSKKRQAQGELAIMVESKKRHARDDSSKRAKKKNRVAEKPNGANPNNSTVQRVWTANDVIVILEGMIDFKLKKGVDPAKQITEFHNYIKRLLHANFSTNQLKWKIRRLKEKYINNFNKYKEGRCKNEHEWKTYDLSKQIWGSDSNTSKKKPSSLNERVEVIDDQYNETIALRNKDGHNPCVEARIIYNALEHMKGRKRMEFEKKLKKLNVEEAEVYLKRVELVREATVYLKGDKSGRN